MNKPIDPNLNNDDSLDFLGNINDEAKEDVSIESSLSISSDEYMGEHHHHHHGEHHHSSHHHSGHHGHHHHHGKHHHHHHHHKKKKPLIVRILIALLIIILLLAVAGAGTFFYLQYQGKNDLQNVQTQTNYEEIIDYNGHKYMFNDNIVAVAFLGVDKRSINDNSSIGTNGQADTDLVLTVDTVTGRTKVIAVPRDTMVDVDLYDQNGKFLRSENMQLCLSFAYGDGKKTSAQNTLTSISRILYNVPISKYFVLDIDGIAPINDAVGGVTVKSLYDFDELGINVGDEVRLTGQLTEKYLRLRDMDTVDASLNRTARQVQYIKAFASQAVPAVMKDFSVVSKLYNTASAYSTTNMDLSNVTYLASFLVSKGVNDFETETLDGNMKLGDKYDKDGFVYAEFYVNEDAVLETVLDTFYTQVD